MIKNKTKIKQKTKKRIKKKAKKKSSTKYRRMIKGLKVKKKASVVSEASQNWHVYILRCSNQHLYTGITNDVEARVVKHNKGTGAKYTRIFGPVVLVYSETQLNRSHALIREYQIKCMPKLKKEQLVKAYETLH